jgi:hypothetical protein
MEAVMPTASSDKDKPTWPRNEGEINVPADPPPGDAETPPAEIGYIGVVSATRPGVRGPFDMDVRVTGPDTVVFGSAQLSTVQTLRLCKLLLLAVQLCGARQETRP